MRILTIWQKNNDALWFQPVAVSKEGGFELMKYSE